ncbi:MAG: aminopeptidase P family protein [Chloroflexi bacterium SZAS-1]|nr:aminopeptidase P family protein [Chloroflexi bacterium SZAS-1]
MPDYIARLQRVQALMAAQGIDLLFLQRSANLHYLTGIAREEQNFGNTMYPGEWLTGAWVVPGRAPILTIPRMLAAFHLDIAGYDVRVLPDAGDPAALARDVLDALGVPAAAAIALDDRAWAETLLGIQALRPAARFVSAAPIMRPLRLIKDENELAIMRHAGAITEAAFADVLPRLRHGMTTLDLITEVNYQLKRHGSTAPSFVTAFYNMGVTFPFDFHNREETQLLPLDAPVSVSFDFGAVYDGYCYDFGRSVFFGDPGATYRRVYELVMGAQAAGIAALRAGNTCEQADAAARAVIADAGYGEAFRHRLGHGIGMDVHEPPFLTAGDSTVLQPGMCFTIEPSIFIPHQLGCRVEDVVVVREQGGEPLTTRFQPLYVVE